MQMSVERMWELLGAVKDRLDRPQEWRDRQAIRRWVGMAFVEEPGMPYEVLVERVQGVWKAWKAGVAFSAELQEELARCARHVYDSILLGSDAQLGLEEVGGEAGDDDVIFTGGCPLVVFVVFSVCLVVLLTCNLSSMCCRRGGGQAGAGNAWHWRQGGVGAAGAWVCCR